MSDSDKTLSGFTAKIDIETAIRNVTKTPRTVFDYEINLDGQKFNAEDILNTLEGAFDGDCYITDQAITQALKKLGVIVRGGSNRGMMSAEKGENYDLFLVYCARKFGH